MTNCIKKSVPSLVDGMLKKYSSIFSQYERVRILSFDPAMKNMGVTSFVVDGSTVDDIQHCGLKSIIEEAMDIEYASRVNLGVELTESFLDIINVVYSTNEFLEELVTTLTGFQEVDSTLVLIEKQPDANHATNKIFETIFCFFCNPKFKNVIADEPTIISTILVDPDVKSVRKMKLTPLGAVAIIPLEGYYKNGITLYKEELERSGLGKNNYYQNKHDTKAIFLKYCSNICLTIPDKMKIDDIADSFCMTVFVIGKLLAYSQDI